jgi:hypothetical protein
VVDVGNHRHVSNVVWLVHDDSHLFHSKVHHF